MPKKFARQRGWTLTELLISVAIIAIIALIVLFMNWKRQIDRSYDARRKNDLNAMRIALEEYYNDKSCFASDGSFNNCGSVDFQPYLPKILCDPQTKIPYLYIIDSQNVCGGYRLCATLKDLSDPDIKRNGCDPVAGCGWGAGYNYCISSGVPVTAPGFASGGNPPTPTSGGGQYQGNYACTPGGQCNGYANPQAQGCPVSFSDSACSNQCGNPATHCPF